MLGAIIGDVIGSTYEHQSVNNFNFPPFNIRSNFTDDTVLTLAVTSCILDNKDYISNFEEMWIHKHALREGLQKHTINEYLHIL